MIFKRIYLEEKNENVYLDIYVADRTENFTRKGLLVIPGGGYWDVCSNREGEPIAMAFMPYGYNTFVLHYSVKENEDRVFPAQLIQASKAMKHIKDHAQEYNINPEQVFVTGFSAGAHLAGCLGILWHKKEIYQEIDMPYGYNKPAGMILVYPVVTGVEEYRHKGSFQRLLGSENPEREKLIMCSLERQVDERSCPVFLVHTSNDDGVSVKNSLVLAEAYSNAGLTFEMHVYPDAPHGMALGNRITKGSVEKFDNPHYAGWVALAAEWAESICPYQA